MVKWLAISDTTKKNTYEQIAEKSGMSTPRVGLAGSDYALCYVCITCYKSVI